MFSDILDLVRGLTSIAIWAVMFVLFVVLGIIASAVISCVVAFKDWKRKRKEERSY